MGQALDAAGVGVEDAPDSGSTDTASIETSSADTSSVSNDSDSSLSDAASPAATPTTSPQQAEPPPGPIPFDRHKAVLEKTRADHQVEMESVAWAKQVPPEVGQSFVEAALRYDGDPVGFVVEMASRLQNDPRHAASLKSHAARLLAQRSPAQAPPVVDDEAMPPADIMVDGHRWYSEAQQAKRDEWVARKLAAQLGGVVDERVGPLAALAQRVADAEAGQKAEKAAKTWANTEFEKVSKLPGFIENRKAIGDAFEAEIAKFPVDQQDAHAAVVIRDVYNAVVLPNLTKASADTVRQTLTAKAVQGSLGARPTSASSVSRPRSMAEALAQANYGA
jgi:hypothetical protein